jgi:hypothetical protein
MIEAAPLEILCRPNLSSAYSHWTPRSSRPENSARDGGKRRLEPFCGVFFLLHGKFSQVLTHAMVWIPLYTVGAADDVAAATDRRPP